MIEHLIERVLPYVSPALSARIARRWAHYRPGDLNLVFEQVHLRRVFKDFGVDCVFDVGANAGQYASMLRDKVGFTGRIVSFEPIPEVAQKLRTKAARDPLWTVHELALSDATGEVDFSVMQNDRFSSLIAPTHAETQRFTDMNTPARRIRVKTDTLDRVFSDARAQFGFQNPFLKMDTQGADLAVARGGSSVIRDFIGLQSELSVVRLYDEAPYMAQAIAAYEDMGFGLSALVPNNKGHFPTLMEVDGIFLRNEFLDRLPPGAESAS